MKAKVGKQKNFRAYKLKTILAAAAVLAEYHAQGYELTLRSLHYKFVARKLYPMEWANDEGNTNTERSYKNLGELVNDGRKAGLIDWAHISDTTRELDAYNHWTSPADIASDAAQWFALDKWEGQRNHVEIWVEKDAQESVIARPARRWDVGFVSARGYPSESLIKVSADRFKAAMDDGKRVVILYLGDHDPSGLDMPESILGRLREHLGTYYANRIELRRLALTKAQIKKYNPAPDPAKTTDSRYTRYRELHGDYSWELDALEPKVLDDLLDAEIQKLCDLPKWYALKKEEDHHREILERAAEKWDKVDTFLDSNNAFPKELVGRLLDGIEKEFEPEDFAWMLRETLEDLKGRVDALPPDYPKTRDEA